MASDTVNRCIWLIDTIRRYGRITRARIDEYWRRSPLSGGRPMPRRSFANYRRMAEEMFKTEIKCDNSTFEYFIEESNADSPGLTEWLLDSVMTNDAIAASHDIADRIFVEDVPSAREHLAAVIDALRHRHPLQFDYHSYTRGDHSRDVGLDPYFIKLFHQRWYVTGRNRADRRIKTYALDRMASLRLVPDTFTPDPAFDPAEYSRNSFGIISGDGEPRHIVLRATPLQAKYLRALPLHSSQQEYVHDGMSLFHYRMRLTRDLVDEILSHSGSLTVEQPAELRDMVVSRLREALDGYADNQHSRKS